MDFSQPNKINSYIPPKIQNQTDYYPNNSMNVRSQNNYMTNSFQHPKCVHQSNNFAPQHHQSMMQPMNEGPNRNFIHKTTKNFEPYAFNTTSSESYCSPPSSYFNPDSYNGHGMMDQQQMQHYENEMSNMNDLNIEYFQCLPQIPVTNRTKKKQANQFRPILESMRKYSENCGKKTHDKIGDFAKNPTFFYSYNSEKNDEEEEPEAINKNDTQFYKSFTKIVSIPNGVKIITEIKKEDNIDVKTGDNGSNNINGGGNKWLNKQIEITLDDINVDDCEDDDDNDTTEFCKEGKKN